MSRPKGYRSHYHSRCLIGSISAQKIWRLGVAPASRRRLSRCGARSGIPFESRGSAICFFRSSKWISHGLARQLAVLRRLRRVSQRFVHRNGCAVERSAHFHSTGREDQSRRWRELETVASAAETSALKVVAIVVGKRLADQLAACINVETDRRFEVIEILRPALDRMRADEIDIPPVCTENLVRVDDVVESLKLAE
jgi:hypothetical protein